jgi:carbamoyl-phosphate synthase large subunit
MSSEPIAPRPRVLITGVGGPSGVCLLRGLATRPVSLLGGDLDPYAAGLYLVEPDQRLMLPPGADEHFGEIMLALCEREAIDVVVPTVDSELIPLAERREQFAGAGVRLVLAPLGSLETCLDKWALDTRCRGQINTPTTLLVDEVFEPATVPLPVIVKPRVGSGSRGIQAIDRVEELERLPRDGSLLVQELLPGPEYSLDVLARSDGRVISVVPRERLKVDSGVAVTSRTLHDEGLEAIGRTVAGLIGLTGVANVQVKRDAHGDPALLEVNPRFPGTMALTVASGVDMPWLCLAETLGEPMPDAALAFSDVAMVRFLQERFLSFDEITRLQAEAFAGAGVAA